MGTTITANLSLIKPDTDESIKENLPTFAGWAAQNALNMDKIDSLFRATNSTYTPTWTATTTNPTLGAGGFIEGKYLRLWPRLVIGHIRIFTGGAGFAVGTGNYKLSLPTGVASEFTSFFDAVALGKAILLDNDTVLNSTVCEMQYTNSGDTLIRTTAGLTWNGASPFALAQNDRLSCAFMYPTSDA